MANPNTGDMQRWWRGLPLDPRPTNATTDTTTEEYWFRALPMDPFPPGSSNITINAPASAATASAPVPSWTGTISANASAATASAPTPNVNYDCILSVPTAPSATGLIPVPSIAMTLIAPKAQATTNNLAPTIQNDLTLGAAASATASVPGPPLYGYIVGPTTAFATASSQVTTKIDLFPPAPTATASAPTPAIGSILLPPAASATASVPAVTVTATNTVSAPVAAATASVPTVLVGTVVNSTAPTATASAPTPSLDHVVFPPAPHATASIPGIFPGIIMLPPAPTATGSAIVPTLFAGSAISPDPALATASSSATLIGDGIVTAPQATATASVPAVQISLKVLPGPAAASASAPLPTWEIDLIAPAPAAAGATTPQIVLLIASLTGRATASAPVPLIKLTLFPPAPTATASAPTPIISITVKPAAASASARAPLPTWEIRLFPPAARATASAPSPQVGTFVLAPPATATAFVPTPTIVSTGALLVPVAMAMAFTGAKVPPVKHHKGWKQHPIAPEISAMGDSVTELSVTMTFKWQASPPVPGDYLTIDAIHRYNNQTYEYNNGWQARTYTHHSTKGDQTFAYDESDSVIVSVVEDKTNRYQRHFQIALSEQAPITSTMNLVAGQDYRLDVVADCSTGDWVVRWKINLVDQPEVLSNRAEYYARAVSPSNWRQVTLLADTSEELNEFDVSGFAYDPAGSYPLP